MAGARATVEGWIREWWAREGRGKVVDELRAWPVVADRAIGTLPSGALPAGVIINPMTDPADLIVGGTSGTPTRLAKGSDSQVLTVDPATHLLVWATPTTGFADPTTTKGDLIVHGASTTRLGVSGNDGYVLTEDSAQADGVKWAAAPAAGGTASLLLNYAASTDIANGVAVSATTWTNLGPNNSFTVTNASALLLVQVVAGAFMRSTSASTMATAVLIDGTTRYVVNSYADTSMWGDAVNAYTTYVTNATRILPALSAGSHTIQVQLYSAVAGSLNCRASTFGSSRELLHVQVVQLP